MRECIILQKQGMHLGYHTDHLLFRHANSHQLYLAQTQKNRDNAVSGKIAQCTYTCTFLRVNSPSIVDGLHVKSRPPEEINPEGGGGKTVYTKKSTSYFGTPKA